MICINCVTWSLRPIHIQWMDTQSDQKHLKLRGCSCYADLSFHWERIKSIPAIFLHWQSAHPPSLITMVITQPCDFGHSGPTQVPDNRLWAKLICSITQNSPWWFKLFVLVYLPFINLSISNSTSINLPRAIHSHFVRFPVIKCFTCNVMYSKWIKIGAAEQPLLLS